MLVKLDRAQIGQAEGLDITVLSATGFAAKFAPTWPMVRGIKDGSMDEAGYIRRYKNILDSLSANVYRQLYRYGLKNGGLVTLLCYCKDFDDQGDVVFCHTLLLAKYLVEHPIYRRGFELGSDLRARLRDWNWRYEFAANVRAK